VAGWQWLHCAGLELGSILIGDKCEIASVFLMGGLAVAPGVGGSVAVAVG
jgi:hypothetical protein